MASSLITPHGSFCFCLGLPHCKLPFLSSTPFANSYISTCGSCKIAFSLKLRHCLPIASSEGLPAELVEEDSKFVPLNVEDPRYGPPALLLLGFEAEEAVKIQQLLKDMDGEFLEVIFCTDDMITCSLWEAINTKQPNLEASKIAKSLPRICFLSGLTGEEMMMFIDAFPESGNGIRLEPPVFAALVPNSADKPVQELIEEIMGDHEMITARKSV